MKIIRLFVPMLFCSLLCGALVLAASAQTKNGQAAVAGELKKWHRVTLTFDGPNTSEDATPNPFRDYKLEVTFTKGTRRVVVPGYYAADGNAGETSATAGNKWRAHFTPDEAGVWRYRTAFGAGTDVAIGATAGRPVAFDGASGALTIAASDKTGSDFRAKGLLQYAGKHYLQFAETKEFFIKGGTDSPENFLAYYEFDGTPAKHKYQPHAGDWKSGDPTWQNGKGLGSVDQAGQSQSAEALKINLRPFRGCQNAGDRKLKNLGLHRARLEISLVSASSDREAGFHSDV